MTKPREFWIQSNQVLLDETESETPFKGYHVREISPEYDALVGELVETLKLYTDRPGRDCDKSTTKWSAADIMIAKYNAFMKGSEE